MSTSTTICRVWRIEGQVVVSFDLPKSVSRNRKLHSFVIYVMHKPHRSSLFMHHRTLHSSKPSLDITMALVNYSGSEDSDQEEQTKSSEAAKGKGNTTKPSFQKVVDRSNPHKIRVSLPEVAKPEEIDDLERPSKRAKVGSGGFSDFNSLLPAPKRTAAPNGAPTTIGARKGGLGVGVNLKTGAAPGFSREPAGTASTGNEDGAEKEDTNSTQQDEDIHLAQPAVDGSPLPLESVEPLKMKGKKTMFKPLSVARKPQKKKAQTVQSLPNPKVQGDGSIQEPKTAPRLSLFSTGEEMEQSRSSSTASGTYQPMIYTTTTPQPIPAPADPSNDPQPPEDDNYYPYDHPEPPRPELQSLTSIASDLNLTRAETRQLLGRQKHNDPAGLSTINIVNFNTDAEYAANEILRQAGETVQHNPVRAIAPGKHSLKQLVNAASSQKDALEESFASGRRNKKEAGSKYGW